EELWVEPATPRVNVSVDGEVAVMEAPLHFRIRPRALRLVAPERPVVHWRFPPGRWSEHGYGRSRRQDPSGRQACGDRDRAGGGWHCDRGRASSRSTRGGSARVAEDQGFHQPDSLDLPRSDGALARSLLRLSRRFENACVDLWTLWFCDSHQHEFP